MRRDAALKTLCILENLKALLPLGRFGGPGLYINVVDPVGEGVGCQRVEKI
jgi:hypothetical protein